MSSQHSKKGKVYVHPASIDFYAKQTWQFAKTILWNNIPFLPEEIELALDYIRQYYRELPPGLFRNLAAVLFEECCKRILVAKQLVKTNPSYTLPHPCLWLNPLYKKGLKAGSTPAKLKPCKRGKGRI